MPDIDSAEVRLYEVSLRRLVNGKRAWPARRRCLVLSAAILNRRSVQEGFVASNGRTQPFFLFPIRMSQ